MDGKPRDQRRDGFLGWLRRRNAAHAPTPINTSTLGPASATLLHSLAKGMSMDDAYRQAIKEIEAEAQAIMERKAKQ